MVAAAGGSECCCDKKLLPLQAGEAAHGRAVGMPLWVALTFVRRMAGTDGGYKLGSKSSFRWRG